ncbi:MAG TPA: isoprenyl transferase [Acholeplasmataceae bacterium]|nr:isoprenyl transferase [Acholeplasmataceae bacterium]
MVNTMKINPENLPRHIAIIMDGNGTWAKKRGLPRNYGHRQGAVALRNIMLHASKLGVEYLTVFAFSTENWKRPKEEVEYLMSLPREFLSEYENEMILEKIRLRWVGSRERLSQDLIKEIEDLEERTKDNQGLVFTIAFNYGGKDEIITAVNDAIKAGKESIGEKEFEEHLSSHFLPDVDLLIRTSNQQRISNFLLWKLAYAELYFTKTLWPDFKPRDLEEAIREYQRRERRFGGIK